MNVFVVPGLAEGGEVLARIAIQKQLVVDDLECASCAKTVIKAISAVVGVENATADIKTKTLTVTPKADKTLSPKDLWEAVEKAGFKPVKFEGPEGAFDKKPAK